MTTPTDILRNSIYSVLNNVHTCLPGIIKSFDPNTSSATIQPALNKNFVSGEIPMPILENVPVMFPRGSNFSISYPIAIGDYCLIIFCERSIDLWKGVGGQVTPNDRRKFDLSDAIAIPGLLPLIGNFPINNGTDFNISFGGSNITINANGAIQIKTSSTVAIGSQITEVLDVISQILGFLSSATAFTDPNVPNVPYTGPLNFAAAAAALKIQLDAIKGVIT